jgi:hypothetical protein
MPWRNVRGRAGVHIGSGRIVFTHGQLSIGLYRWNFSRLVEGFVDARFDRYPTPSDKRITDGFEEVWSKLR